MKYYKFLREDGRSPYSNFDYSPYLENGEWLPEITDELVECKVGYHGCLAIDLPRWIDAQLWEFEYREPPIKYDDKVNGRQIRFVKQIETWNERTARLFAVWCAREALKLIDDPDPRSVDACNVAERFANGKATAEELEAAYRAADWAADWAAERAAYWATESAAHWAAHWAADWAADWAAYRAIRKRQGYKLIEMLGLEE